MKLPRDQLVKREQFINRMPCFGTYDPMSYACNTACLVPGWCLLEKAGVNSLGELCQYLTHTHPRVRQAAVVKFRELQNEAST